MIIGITINRFYRSNISITFDKNEMKKLIQNLLIAIVALAAVMLPASAQNRKSLKKQYNYEYINRLLQKQ